MPHLAVRRCLSTPEAASRGTEETGVAMMERGRGAMNAVEAGEYLSMSERTVRRLSASGELRAVRYGRLVRYRPEDLDAWLEEHVDAA